MWITRQQILTSISLKPSLPQSVNVLEITSLLAFGLSCDSQEPNPLWLTNQIWHRSLATLKLFWTGLILYLHSAEPSWHTYIFVTAMRVRASCFFRFCDKDLCCDCLFDGQLTVRYPCIWRACQTGWDGEALNWSAISSFWLRETEKLIILSADRTTAQPASQFLVQYHVLATAPRTLAVR